MSYIRTFLAMFRGRKLATFGLIWLCIVALAAITAPLIAPFDPLDFDPVARLTEPGLPYLFGTDHFGRDSFSRAIYGARMAVIIGLGSVDRSAGHGRVDRNAVGLFHPSGQCSDARY